MSETVEQGQFVWHELLCENPKELSAFYSKVFGWRIQEVPMGMGPYNLIYLDETRHTGGIFSPPPGGPPAKPGHWLVYIHVQDVDAKAKQAEELGGKICMPPMDIPDTGRFAVIQDPTGAAFALWRHATGENPSLPEMPKPGEFCWYRLNTKDPKAAAAFYSAMFGWDIQFLEQGADGNPMWMVKNHGREICAMGDMPPGHQGPSFWVPIVAVDNVETAVSTASANGAMILMPATDINIGILGLFMDPSGGVIGAFKWTAPVPA